MLVEINRMIQWMEHYALPKEEICQLLHDLAEKGTLLPQSEAAKQLEMSLQRVVPDPCDRARFLYSMVQSEPEEEIEPEEIYERTQLLTMLLHSLREIVESADSKAEAAGKIDAII